MTDWSPHDYEKRLRDLKQSIQESSLPEKDKALLLGFERACVVEGLGIPRREKLLRHAFKIGQLYLNVPLSEATKKDLVDAVAQIEGNTAYAPTTKRDLKIAVRKLYRWWVYQEDFLSRKDHPPIVSWIRVHVPKRYQTHVERSHLPTPEEIDRLVESERNPRNRAFLAVLYELGPRIGEIARLKVGDVTRDKYSLLVSLPCGKTKPRTLPLIVYASHLVTWMNLHPRRDDPMCPLWPGLQGKRRLQAMPYHRYREWIQKAKEAAGIEKRLHPHLFRHARYTHLKDAGFSDGQLNVFFGHSPDSRMPSVYSHLVTGDVKNALLRTYGIKDAPSLKLEARNCGMCRSPNPANGKFCYRCGYALSEEAIQNAEARKKNAEHMVERFLSKPEIRELFKRMIRDEMDKDDNDDAPHPSGPRPPGPSSGAAGQNQKKVA